MRFLRALCLLSLSLTAGCAACGSVTFLAPNSGVLVLPKMTSPASRQRRTTSASSGAGTAFSARLPPEEGRPFRS